MNYNIIGVFPTVDAAISASSKLLKAGYIKEFVGYTANTNVQPESLVEDHFVDHNEIAVYTPNLNRAYKAKNILEKFGAAIIKATMIKEEEHQKKEKWHISTPRIRGRKRRQNNSQS